VGLASNLLNPKIAVFYTGLLPQLVPRGAPYVPTLIGLVLVHAVLGLGWLSLYATAVTRAAATLRQPRVRAVLERTTGVILVGFGLRVAAISRS
jgi:threonine/homoserine/homoserine lactone efflux protein